MQTNNANINALIALLNTRNNFVTTTNVYVEFLTKFPKQYNNNAPANIEEVGIEDYCSLSNTTILELLANNLELAQHMEHFDSWIVALTEYVDNN